MPFLVVNEAMLSCSYGTCPKKLTVVPLKLPETNFNVNVSAQATAGGALGAGLTVPNGPVTKYNASGGVASTSVYADGKLHGEMVVYGDGGHATQKLMYVKGKVHGAVTTHTQGVCTAQIAFKAGVMDGQSKFYNAKGQLVLQTNFEGGVESGARVNYDAKSGAVLKKVAVVKGTVQGAAGAGAGVGVGVALPSVSASAGADVGALATIGGKAMGTINAYLPNINIKPFCLCTSLANPAVAAATASSGGALQPQPCTPKTSSPWIGGSHDVTMLDEPTLTHTAKLICAYGGIIGVNEAEQKKVEVP